MPTDGKTVDTACWCGAWKGINSRYLQSTVRILVARSDGFRSPACSCARATAGRITATVRVLQVRRNAPVEYPYKVQNGLITIEAGELPTRGHDCSSRWKEAAVRRLITQVGEWFDRRLQLAAPIREVSEHPVPRKHGKLVVRVRQCCSRCVPSATRHRNPARDDLRSIGQRGVEQSASSEP